ncbi:tubulin-like doman-containing protein [Butyrivibrio sp. AE2032]|uniref:tubulin-like doman-containing protein n=1 Tax=Butyrivibrio sp. AE2032 TaxID=1458463 RepID=UPI00055569A2|nr:tubulin-like doman-containing protein [Butyrivibrio sp. AE2032]
MIDRLLLCKQGGIIDVSQMAEQDNSVHICIGLGGTGVDCLKNLKAKVYDRICPDDIDSPVPQYSHIKFLAVDSDRRAFEYGEKSGFGDFCKLDPYNEYFPIGQGVRNSDLFQDKRVFDSNPAFREWLEHTNIRSFSADAGAGGVPQIGRYLFACQANAFFDVITNMINQASIGLSNPYVYIHIFSGVSGGTGAGAFLDVCYLVREAIKNAVANNCILCGYFFLPDVYGAKGIDDYSYQYIKNNGYAALQELDYCMNYEKNGDKWSQYYKGIGLVESIRQPVDFCHLISATTSNGDMLADGYDYALNVVTDFILGLLVKPDNHSSFSWLGYFSELYPRSRMINKEFGAAYKYCTLGAATATVPHKEMMTYLASELFENMYIAVIDKIPNENDLTDFMNRNSLSYNRIFDMLTQGADLNFSPMPDVNWRDAQANDNLTVTYFEDMKCRVLGKIQENYSTLSRKIDDYSTISDCRTANTRSLISRIFESLKYLATDPACGPFYAAKLLRSTIRKDLVAVIDGYIKTANEQREQENAQEDKLYSEWKNAQDEFFSGNTNVINGNRRYKIYANATRNLIIHRARAETYAHMLHLLNALHIQLMSLSSEYMDKLLNTIKRLKDTFDENKRYLAEDGFAIHPSYEIPIATINDVMPELLSTVAAMNMDQNIHHFMLKMTSKEGVDAWINSNEDKISMFINHYFTDVFFEYSQKTMTEYFQTKYKTTTPEQLVHYIETDFLNNLRMRADPMFWTSNTYDIRCSCMKGYITVPDFCVEAREAAMNLAVANRQAFAVVDGAFSDRISILNYCYGIPLYGYNGVYWYENDSVNSKISGQHIYEGKSYKDDGKEIIGRDWRLLPSPIPFRLMQNKYSNSELMRLAEEAKDLYLEAEAKGVIHDYDYSDFGIFTISDAFMCSFRNAFEDGKKNEYKDDRLQTQDQLEHLSKNIEYNSPIPIPNDCTLSDVERKREVRIEHFVKSPCLQKIVRAELDKLKEINDTIHYFD